MHLAQEKAIFSQGKGFQVEGKQVPSESLLGYISWHESYKYTHEGILDY